MALYRDLLTEKLNSACKKLAIPYIRVEDVTMGDSVCKVESNIGQITVSYSESQDDEKSVVHKFIEESKDVQPYRSVKVTGVGECETKSLSIGQLPDSFEITGLPYKQLKVSIGDSPIFVDLCKQSYTRVYNYLYSLYSKDAEISFEKLSSLIKRKELLVLSLSISK